jgi:putative transposase
LSATHPSSQRERWARLRFSIIGPLLAAPPEPGQLHAALGLLSNKLWRHPLNAQDVRFGISTLERWYYAARHAADPVAALKNRLRGNVGRFPSLSPEIIEALQAQYREHPGWTTQLHVDNLRAALKSASLSASPLNATPVNGHRSEALYFCPSYPTLRRYMVAHGMHRQARLARISAGALAARDRLERLEVRSFEVDHVNALWHLDFHHGSRRVLTPAGAWMKPYLLGVIDDRSRLVCHLQWYLEETTHSLIHGLSQACMKRGLPRSLMTDNGAAMLADETVSGLAALGIVHQTTLPYSPYQNAKQESFWGRIEGRLMAMLEGEESLTLELLNQATQAWVEQEYHRAHHSEIDTTPLARYLAGPNVRRECPSSTELRAAFRIEVNRRQRRSDGTVSLAGQRFEIPSAYRHLPRVHLRYARWDLSTVDLVDARSGAILCAVRPLDKSANADGRRRPLSPIAQARPDDTPLTPTGIAPLLRQLLADYAATGLPPAYLPSALVGEPESTHINTTHPSAPNITPNTTPNTTATPFDQDPS